MSPWRAWWVLVLHSVQRHWRVRQMGWVALGLLALSTVAVYLNTRTQAGWGIAERKIPSRFALDPKDPKTRVTYREYFEQLQYPYRFHYDSEKTAALDFGNPVARGVRDAVYFAPLAVLQSPKFLDDWAVINYSRWVMFGLYLGFILPLFTLSYATGAMGLERESRSMIWLLTRPIPRWAVYLAKYLGVLPWCLLFNGGGFVALCLAGGEPGRRALGLYWPAVAAGTLAFAALFHLVGAVFRRPAVVGLVYIFFFESLVVLLPGSLKKLSLNFYTRSLMYNEAVADGLPPDTLDVVAPANADTCWMVLLGTAAVLTALGMLLFSRMEFRDDV
jgi:ABC-type transport system involved in multi-copper enzyme maturation permease subunit